MAYRILLLEDEESLNRGISLKLEKEGYLVDRAHTLKEAYGLFEQNIPDLIICDVGLPDGSGLDFCVAIRKKSDVLFLFLTAMDTELDMITGYDAGADDYMTKPFSLMVLLSKVNAMLQRARKKEMTELEMHSGDIVVRIQNYHVTVRGNAISLTPNEFKLLRLFMEHPRQILTKGQLLEALWDLDSEFVDDNTVAVNIRRLREKIEENPSEPIYIKNIRGMGYLWDKECTS